MWLERHVLVMPSLNPDQRVDRPARDRRHARASSALFGWAVQGFLTKYPSVKVTDAVAAPAGHGH